MFISNRSHLLYRNDDALSTLAAHSYNSTVEEFGRCVVVYAEGSAKDFDNLIELLNHIHLHAYATIVNCCSSAVTVSTQHSMQSNANGSSGSS
jgi:hypothetical protein